MIKKILLILILLSIPIIIMAGVGLTWGYHYVTRDLPQLDTVEDYRPQTVTSVYAKDGTLIAEFFKERRYPAKIDEIPLHVRNAFLAAEDASFYRHPGIDVVSIARAFIKNLQTGRVSQGGSTITQQVVKNLLLSSERKVIRKLKEAVLSYRIEQRLSKDDILEIYLNQIYFGNSAYGIKSAAQLYYHKELKDLTLAEGALLAGLPKAPSRFSPVHNFPRAKTRQRYVLRQMARAQFVSKAAARAAVDEEIKVYSASPSNIYHAPYYVSEVRRLFKEQFRELDIDRDGLSIYTPLDLAADRFASDALRNGLHAVDKRRGWRGPIESFGELDTDRYIEKYGDSIPAVLLEDHVYPALVTHVSPGAGKVSLLVGSNAEILDISKATWARRRLVQGGGVQVGNPAREVREGDVIEVIRPAGGEGHDRSTAQPLQLAQSPEVEGALVALNPHSGRVVTILGGYSYQRSQFNRATKALRQPGSAFKPIVYLAAIDGFNYTPATIVYDAERTFRVGDDLWTPANFDGKFMGGIPLRLALEKSRNLVSADIISKIGVDAAIQYAVKLGIKTQLGRNLSLSLGSSEVTPLEMTRAYGVFANRGVFYDSVFIDKVVNRQGTVVFDYDTVKLDNARPVIDEKSAFIMANLMKGVVQRGTGWRIRALKRPAAGKTGTSNDQMDGWFIGYTPEWVCGVWVGFDLKRTIGKTETGGKVSAPIFLEFMQNFLSHRDRVQYEQLVADAKKEAEQLGIEYVAPEPLEPLDFAVPDGVDALWVDRMTGQPTIPSNPDAIYEYFISGTAPIGSSQKEDTSAYLDSPEL